MAGEDRRQRYRPLAVWCVALAAGTALLHALGSGALAPPPPDPAAWGTWLDGREPLVATMALLRLVVLMGCWYLVGVTVVGLLARVVRAGRLLRLADAVTLPPLRRLLQQTLGAAVATGLVVSVSAPGGSALPAPVELRLVAAAATDDADAAGGSPAGPGGAAGSVDDGAPSVTLRGLPYPPLADRATPGGTADERPAPRDADAGTTPTPPSPPRPSDRPLPPAPMVLPWQIGSTPDEAEEGRGDTAPGAAAARPAAPSDVPTASSDVPTTPIDDAGPVPTDHTVRAGESLWRIASDRLTQVHGRSPSDAEVVPYWRELIELNRDRLPDRDDPDLILPGQELLLPPVVP
jgi:hypothetical protein